MWEAAIVEVSLKWFLELWEICNNDVHGHTKTEQTTRLQTRHRITARRMMTQRPLVRPSDQWMFPTDPEAYLETATAHQLGTWIASRRKTIKNSTKMAAKESSRGTANITTFFQPKDPGGVARMQRWQQDKLVHDAYCKKKRRKAQPASRSAQQKITGYLTLRGQLD